MDPQHPSSSGESDPYQDFSSHSFLPAWSELPNQAQPVVYGVFMPQGVPNYSMGAPMAYAEPQPQQQVSYPSTSYSDPEMYQPQAPFLLVNGRGMPVFMPGPQGDAGNLLQEQHVETMQYQNFPLDEEAPAAGVSNTPATPRINNNGAMIMNPVVNPVDPNPVGVQNGEGDPEPQADAPRNRPARRPRRRHPMSENTTYITKPPNAFMLFMSEQRHTVESEIKKKGSAAVNAFLGRKWKTMTDQQQSKYYDEAERLRGLHKMQHPDWSNRENYGKKVTTRDRKKAEKKAEAMNEEDQQATECKFMATVALQLQVDVTESHDQQGNPVEQVQHSAPPLPPDMFNMAEVPDNNPSTSMDFYGSWMELLASNDLYQEDQPNQDEGDAA